MSELRLCPECNAEIPADSPAGLCPKCLLKTGLASESRVAPELQVTQPHTPPRESSGFVPPTAEELAARFPQLEILELLGRGGMGAVYKARQRGLDRLVAVKILPPEISRDPTFADRFRREAKALAKLSHQHIVTIHDFGQADGQFYFVMEYVDGVNLRQAMQAGKIAPKEALSIVSQVCDALQFAHDEGIVHRDIKPANILIDKRGRAKIADFGLAKLLGQNQPDLALTGTHEIMGTLRYMAPEQMEGSKSIDHRADIYSLGVVFYELLTGELPMGRFAPPSKKVQVDVRLDEIVLRALEQEPELRYQHASDVRTEIETVSKSMPATKVPQAEPKVETPVEISAEELERLVLPLLPGNMQGAMKLYREKTGVGAYSSAMAVQTIMKKYDLKRPWRQTAVETVTVIAFFAFVIGAAYFGSSWWELLSPIVSVPLLLLAVTLCTVEAVRFRGTTRGQRALAVIGLILVFTIWLPLINFLAKPEATLNRLYDLTGIAPGPYDVGVLQALNHGISLFWLGFVAWGLFKAIKLKKKHEPKSRPAERVKTPAALLAATGVTQLVTSLIWLPMALQDQIPWLAALSIASAALGIFVIVGAARMMRFQSYQGSRLTCFLAMMPSLGMGWLQGIPVGIWALRTLKKPEVRIAFAEKEREQTEKMLAESRQNGVEPRPESEGVPFRFYLMTMLISGLGWLLFPLLWNLREPGLVVSCLAVGLITVWNGRAAARYLPATVKKWRQRPALWRWAATMFCILFAAGGAYMGFYACFTTWESKQSNWPVKTAEEFTKEYQGKEHQLLLRTGQFENEPPRAELRRTDWPPYLEPEDIFWYGASGPPLDRRYAFFVMIMASFCAFGLILATYLQMLSDLTWWGIGWKRFGNPSVGLTCATLFVLAVPIVWTLVFQSIRPIGVSVGFHTSEQLPAIRAHVQRWASVNGYAQYPVAPAWELKSLRDETLAQVEHGHYFKPNIFDRWEMTLRGLQRKSPEIAVQSLRGAKSILTTVEIGAAMPVADSPSAEECRQQIDDLRNLINEGFQSHQKNKKATLKQRLIGKWVAENDEIKKTHFKSDGTYEETSWEWVPDLKPDEPPYKGAPKKKSEFTVNGQYTWLDNERLEFKTPRQGTFQLGIVMDGEVLTLKQDDGGFFRWKRSK